ncbi:MAG: metallopeptidase TldD-related protein, partial [Desulfurococcaceae archaeon]
RSPCTFNNLAIQVKVSTERGTSDWTFYSNNRRVDLKELYEAIDRESAIAVLFGGSKPVKSGKYNIILYNNVLSNLLSDVLVPALSALNVLHRRSPLRDKLQQAIFSEKISLSDDPTLRLERGSRPFDDEGVSTNSKALVDRGTLKNFLHNYYTSRKFNAQGSGNGFRRSPEVSPTPMPTNLVLKGDSGSIEEFIKETSRGLVIYDVIGQWMSNPVTGYIKANITHGLLVESGEISQAVKGSIVVGNIYEWLGNSLDNLGSDTKVYSGVAAPSAVIRSVDVGGE